jgi:hypothetical protein
MTQMKNYTQYIYKDDEWRVLGGSGQKQITELTGTSQEAINLNTLSAGFYKIKGNIVIGEDL